MCQEWTFKSVQPEYFQGQVKPDSDAVSANLALHGLMVHQTVLCYNFFRGKGLTTWEIGACAWSV